MKSRLAFLLVPALVACEVPVASTEDTPSPSTFIAGAVELAEPGGDGLPGGPAFVFRYDCAAPPAPAGTGRPVDFLVLTEEAFSGGRAEFVFPQVPAATCAILTGFVDRDRDFDPFATITNQATRGDLAMTAVSVATPAMTEGSESLAPVEGVRLRAETPVPLDRPAFIATGIDGELGARVALGPATGTTGNTLLRLQTQTLRSALTDAEDPLFTLVFAADADGNGWPDDNNGDGLPDILWPRVLFVSIDPADETGLTQESPPTVLPGVVLPLDPSDPVNLDTNRVLASRLAGLPFDGTQVLPVSELTVVLPPLVVTDLAAATTAPIEDGDTVGDYQIVVMNSSGQTWSVPNELAAAEPSQGARVTVAPPEEPPAPRGVVAGAVDLGADPEGMTLVTAFDCANPPPPQGTGRPIELASLTPSRFSGGVAPFSFDAIPAESCLIITGYVDVDADFAALYSVSQLPTEGDLLLSAEVVTTPAAVDGLVEPVLDVVVSATVPVPLDAPAFSTPTAVMQRRSEVGATAPVFLTLSATDHVSAFTTSDDPMFTVVLGPDADGNGLPDDNNGDAVPDVLWPRVLLLRLDPSDPLGLATMSPPVVLPGVVLPLDPSNPADLSRNLALQAELAGAPFDGLQTVLTRSLTVAVPPLVVTDLATATTAPLESVALSGLAVDGDYAIVVMNSSGQTWQVPNEALLFGDAQQVGFRVEPPDPEASGLGSVQGRVSTGDGSEPGGDTLVFAFDCAAPPPPAGGGSPVDFVIVPPSAWSGGEASFRFPGLAAGACLLLTGFIDRDDDWSGLYGTSNQATAGDLALSARTVVVPQPDPLTGIVPDVVNQNLNGVLTVPLERPAFTMLDVASGGTEEPVMTVGATPGSTASVMLSLSASPQDSPLARVASPLFTLTFVPDGNADGAPDDLNGDGLPDLLWPRVLVRRLDPSDPAGLAVEEDGVVLPGVVVPLNPADPGNPATNYIIQHAQAGLPFDGASVLPVSSLTVAVPGLVVTDLSAGTVAPIETQGEVGGVYQVLLMNSSGQTWALPNELGLLGDDSQGAVFVVE